MSINVNAGAAAHLIKKTIDIMRDTARAGGDTEAVTIINDLEQAICDGDEEEGRTRLMSKLEQHANRSRRSKENENGSTSQ